MRGAQNIHDLFIFMASGFFPASIVRRSVRVERDERDLSILAHLLLYEYYY